MPQIDVTPLVLKDVILTIGENGDTYEKHVSGVTFTPTASAITWRGLSPNAVFTDPGSVTWSCALNYVQDWDTANSLSQFLFDNEGQTVTMEFKPKSGSGPSFTADVIIIPGAIGGQVNTYAATTVTLGVQGRPVLVPAGTGA